MGWVVASQAGYSSGKAGAGAAVDGIIYITRESECLGFWANLAPDGCEVPGGWDADRAGLVAGWGCIVTRELARRRDARHTQRLILPLPNTLTPDQQRQFVQRWITSTGLDKHPCVVALHRGQDGEDGVSNLHVHLATCPRRFDGRADLDMSRRKWLILTRDHAADGLKALGIEIETARERRERIAKERRAQIALERGVPIEDVPLVDVPRRARRVHRCRYECDRWRDERADRTARRLALRTQGRVLRRERAALARECRRAVTRGWGQVHRLAARAAPRGLPREAWERAHDLNKAAANGDMVASAIAWGERAAREGDAQQRRLLRLACATIAAAHRDDWPAAYETTRPVMSWLDRQARMRRDRMRGPALSI